MRGIKFKSYTPSGMVDVLSIDFTTGFAKFEDVLGIQFFDVKEFPLLQYTGLKDKNGREIYEGDIIKKSNRSSNLYEIIYQDSISGFRCKVIKGDIKSFPCLNIGTVRNYEVIGNIYEKSELLEEEHE